MAGLCEAGSSRVDQDVSRLLEHPRSARCAELLGASPITDLRVPTNKPRGTTSHASFALKGDRMTQLSQLLHPDPSESQSLGIWLK